MATINENSTSGSDRSGRRVRVGVVSSDARNKTIRVECRFSVKHRKYGKYINRRTSLHAHDENNEARTGDRVEIMECRPLSKQKHWRLIKVLDRA